MTCATGLGAFLEIFMSLRGSRTLKDWSQKTTTCATGLRVKGHARQVIVFVMPSRALKDIKNL
jgi:hypothetical protein